MTSRRCRLLAGLCFVGVLSLTIPSRAQEGPAGEAKARSLFEAGGRAYDNGEFDVALDAFERAYAVFPKQSLLFSMGQAHRRLYIETKDAAHLEQAKRLLRDYLKAVPSGRQRLEANRTLGELEKFVTSDAAAAPVASVERGTRLYVASATPNAVVSIDGGPPAKVNQSIKIGPGKHKLTIQAAGFADQSLDVEVAEGEVLPLSYDLVALPAKLAISSTNGASISIGGRFVGEAPLAAPIVVEAGEQFVAAELDGHVTRSSLVVASRGSSKELDLSLETTSQRYLAYTFFATAAAAAVASGTFTGVALLEQGRANDILEKQKSTGLQDGDLADYEGSRNLRDRFALAAGISGGAAGALVVVGLGLFLVDKPERAMAPQPAAGKEPKPPTTPAPFDFEQARWMPLLSPDLAGLAVALEF